MTYVATVLGAILLLLGGACLSILVFYWLSATIIERALRSFDLYYEFLAFALPRVRARWRKN